MSEPTYQAPPPTGSPVPRDAQWRRLDGRMLLVHPVNEVVRFFPAIIGLVVVGRGSQGGYWELIGVGVPVLLGVIRFLTTRFRITSSQIELQRGLLSKKVLTARLDRVRAVELTASPIHRILGLTKVQIGTGSAAKDGDDSFALDSLALAEARDLRLSLLHRAGDTPAEAGETPVPSEDVVLLRLDPRWVRFAPLTTSGNVIAAALLGASANLWGKLDLTLSEDSAIVQRFEAASVVALVVFVVLGFLVLGAVFGVFGYLVQNWGFTLARDSRGRTFHVRRGLFTSRETSLEVERVRGVEAIEPLGLRMAGAARLAAIVTGVSKKESGTTQLVPPAPRGIIDTVGSSVLEDSDPLHVALLQHGPRARRRRFTRALVPTSVVPLVVLALVSLNELSWWVLVVALLLLVLAALVARDRYRRLGHALTDGYLVVRSGTFRGRRDVLQTTGIIGWNLHQSFFQRRAGLATLVATTAAGHQAYAALDIPLDQAVALADEAVPGLLTPFLA